MDPNNVEEQKNQKIYLDYNATTPLEPSVLTAIHDALQDAWGNPSSSYTAGKKAAQVIKQARTSIGHMIGGLSSDIIFTSGGTEANNMVIHSALEHFHVFYDEQENCNPSQKPHVITSNLEHDSIQLPLLKLKEEGRIEVTFVPASQDSGAVTTEAILHEVKPNTCLVTVMMANNETGVIQVTKGAYQKSELTSETSHFENEIGFFREFSLKTHNCYAYHVETNSSGWTFLINSGILFTNGLVWPASSD